MERRIQSPTSINTYLRCPRKYYLRYIKGYKTKPNIHLVRGTAVHKTISKISCIPTASPPLEPTKEILVQTFKTAWQNQQSAIETLKLCPQTVDNLYRESETMLLSWFDRQAKNKVIHEQSEVRLYSKIFGVMGIIDAVCSLNQKVVLIDYKTCAGEEISQDIRVQLAIYTLLYRENFGIMPDIVGIDFLRSGKLRLFNVNPKLLGYAKDMCWFIHAKTRSRSEEDYPCRCGGKCYKDFGL